VIWRQNQQTYDAFSIVNKGIPGLARNYAYISQVNRIFGSDADRPIVVNKAGVGIGVNVEDVQSQINLFNASYTGIKGLTLGGHAYIMNFEDIGSRDSSLRSMASLHFKIRQVCPAKTKRHTGMPR